MNKYELHLSENGWEYTGFVEIECKKLEQLNSQTIKADNVIIRFDEEIIIKK